MLIISKQQFVQISSKEIENKRNKIKNNIMKKLNLLFTALLLLCCIGTAKAEEVTIDGIKYDVDTEAKLATVIKGDNLS